MESLCQKLVRFEDNGGIVGVDYMVCPNFRYAYTNGHVNRNFGKRPNQVSVLLLGRVEDQSLDTKRGTLVKFIGYLHAHSGISNIGTVYPEESG